MTSSSQLLDSAWPSDALLQPQAYKIRALRGIQERSVDFQIVDARPVYLFLPQAHRQWHGVAGRAGDISLACRAGGSPFHDDLNRAANADKQHRQANEPARAVGEATEGPRIGIVVADIHHDIQSQPAVSGNRFVESCVETRHKAFEVRTLATRPQPNSRSRPQRRGLLVDVDAEIHPDAFEILLDGLDNARFSRSRRAVQDDDLAAHPSPRRSQQKSPVSGAFSTFVRVSSFVAVAARGCACRRPCPWAQASASPASSPQASSPRPCVAWEHPPALPSSA